MAILPRLPVKSIGAYAGTAQTIRAPLLPGWHELERITFLANCPERACHQGRKPDRRHALLPLLPYSCILHIEPSHGQENKMDTNMLVDTRRRSRAIVVFVVCLVVLVARL